MGWIKPSCFFPTLSAQFAPGVDARVSEALFPLGIACLVGDFDLLPLREAKQRLIGLGPIPKEESARLLLAGRKVLESTGRTDGVANILRPGGRPISDQSGAAQSRRQGA